MRKADVNSAFGNITHGIAVPFAPAQHATAPIRADSPQPMLDHQFIAFTRNDGFAASELYVAMKRVKRHEPPKIAHLPPNR